MRTKVIQTEETPGASLSLYRPRKAEDPHQGHLVGHMQKGREGVVDRVCLTCLAPDAVFEEARRLYNGGQGGNPALVISFVLAHATDEGNDYEVWLSRVVRTRVVVRATDGLTEVGPRAQRQLERLPNINWHDETIEIEEVRRMAV